MKNIIWYLKRFIIDKLKVNKLKKYYSRNNKLLGLKTKTIIYMADGKMLHGGLSDRLCGIISTYDYCKKNGIDFKIHFNSPYNLTDYLLPNRYDWTIDESQISFNLKESEPVYIPYYSKNYDFQKKIAEKRLKKSKKQIHVYTNMRYFEEINFSELFFELFQLSNILQKKIDDNMKLLPHDFISITLRFQQLLGDFDEGNFPKLKNDEEKKELITKCISKIENIKKENPNYSKILVTSDSKIFLESVKDLPYVYTIPGEVVHLDFNKDKSLFDAHLKSFVDLFVIANAKKIYLVNFNPLYQSTFPKTASFIKKTQFYEFN